MQGRQLALRKRLAQGQVEVGQQAEVDAQVRIEVGIAVIGRFALGGQCDRRRPDAGCDRGTVVVVVDVVVRIGRRFVRPARQPASTGAGRYGVARRRDHFDQVGIRQQRAEQVVAIAVGDRAVDRRAIGDSVVIGIEIQVDRDTVDARLAGIDLAVVVEILPDQVAEAHRAAGAVDLVVLDLAIGEHAGRRTAGLRRQAEAGIRIGHVAGRHHAEVDRDIAVDGAARHPLLGALVGVVEIAVAVPVHETAQGRRTAGGIGHACRRRARAALIVDRTQLHAILVITGNRAGAAGERARTAVVAAGSGVGLAIVLVVDAGADVQSRDDAVGSAVVGEARAVVAAGVAGSGIGQVAEIIGTEADHIVLDFAIGFGAGRRARRAGRTEAEARIRTERRTRFDRSEDQRELQVAAAVRHRHARQFARIGEVAVGVEVDEAANPCRVAGGVGRGDPDRMQAGLDVVEIAQVDAVLVVRRADGIVAVGIDARLAIGLVVHRRAHEQTRHDVVLGATVGDQGLVVAGAGTGAGIGQVAEIDAAHVDDIVLDLAIAGEPGHGAGAGAIGTESEAGEGRTARRVQRLAERQQEGRIVAAAGHAHRGHLDTGRETAVLVEVDEPAQARIGAGEVGRVDPHRTGLADHEGQAGRIDAVFVIAGLGVVAAGDRAGLAVRFGIDPTAHEQAGDDRMHRAAVGQQGLVVAGAGAGRGIRQVAEIGDDGGERIVLDLAIRRRTIRRTAGRGAETEARVAGRHGARRRDAEVEHDRRIVAAVGYRRTGRFAGIGEIAIAVEVDEAAQRCRRAYRIGGRGGHADRSAAEEGESGRIDRILVVVGHRAGSVGQGAGAEVVTVCSRVGLAIDLGILAGAEAQAGTQHVRRSAAGDQGLVVARADADAAVGQVAEVDRVLHVNRIVLDFAIAGRTGRRAGDAGIGADAESGVARTDITGRHGAEGQRDGTAAAADIKRCRLRGAGEHAVAVVVDEAADARRSRPGVRIVVADADIARRADVLGQVGHGDAILVIRHAVAVVAIGADARLAVDFGVDIGAEVQCTDDRMDRTVVRDQGGIGVRRVAEVDRLHETEIDAVVRGRIGEHRVAVGIVVGAAEAQGLIGRFWRGRRGAGDRTKADQGRGDRVRRAAADADADEGAVVVVVAIGVRVRLVGHGREQAGQGELARRVGDRDVVVVAGREVGEPVLARIAGQGAGDRARHQRVARARSGAAVGIAAEQHGHAIDAGFADVGATVVALGRIAGAVIAPDQVAEAIALGKDHADLRRFGRRQQVGRDRGRFLEYAMGERIPGRVEHRRIALNVRCRAADIARRRAGGRCAHRHVDFEEAAGNPFRGRRRRGQVRKRANAETGRRRGRDRHRGAPDPRRAAGRERVLDGRSSGLRWRIVARAHLAAAEVRRRRVFDLHRGGARIGNRIETGIDHLDQRRNDHGRHQRTIQHRGPAAQARRAAERAADTGVADERDRVVDDVFLEQTVAGIGQAQAVAERAAMVGAGHARKTREARRRTAEIGVVIGTGRVVGGHAGLGRIADHGQGRIALDPFLAAEQEGLGHAEGRRGRTHQVGGRTVVVEIIAVDGRRAVVRAGERAGRARIEEHGHVVDVGRGRRQVGRHAFADAGADDHLRTGRADRETAGKGDPDQRAPAAAVVG